MIRLNVFIQVEKQNYDQVVNIAKELVAASQKDNGSLRPLSEHYTPGCPDDL